MKPPEGESEPRPATRSSRILGLLAAVGFSIAMWAFIAMAVIGLILKIIGPTDAQKGLSAAGASMSQMFNPDSKETDTDPADGLTGDLGTVEGPITTLDGQAVEPAKSKAPVAREPGNPPETPAKPAPVIAPH
jgi:hypothetical protein